MGPVSAKTYPAKRWAPQGKRPPLKPDYGRRAKVWVFGAFEPSTGTALTLCQERRRSLDFIELLDAVVQKWPNDELILILDNLSIHRSIDVQYYIRTRELRKTG